jgi:hypothetical protein
MVPRSVELAQPRGLGATSNNETMDKDKALNERRNRKKGALTFAGYRLRTRSRQPGGGVKDRYTLDQGTRYTR